MPMVPAEFRGERGQTALVSLFLAASRAAPEDGLAGDGHPERAAGNSSGVGRLVSDQPRVARR